MKLKIVLEQGMDGYITAYCPALKGCVTQGKTEAVFSSIPAHRPKNKRRLKKNQ